MYKIEQLADLLTFQYENEEPKLIRCPSWSLLMDSSTYPKYCSSKCMYFSKHRHLFIEHVFKCGCTTTGRQIITDRINAVDKE